MLPPVASDSCTTLYTGGNEVDTEKNTKTGEGSEILRFFSLILVDECRLIPRSQLAI